MRQTKEAIRAVVSRNLRQSEPHTRLRTLKGDRMSIHIASDVLGGDKTFECITRPRFRPKTASTEWDRPTTINGMSPAPDPSPILQTAFGFWSSKVLLSAVEMGLFTVLRDRKLTGAELAGEIGLHPRAISDFFDALVAMKFLERDGDGAAARYFNTPLTALYLDRNSPRYIGGILEMLNGRLLNSGTICRKLCAPASRKTRRSTAARECSKSCTPTRRGSSSSSAG